MSEKGMWMVHAGPGGKAFDDFKERAVVAIRWVELGDLTPFKDKDAIRKAVNARWPEWTKGKAAISAGQLYRFIYDIQVGDRVLTYDPSRRVYLVGTVSGPYEYDPKLLGEFANYRRVKWEGEVDRDSLPTSSKYSLGAIATLFLVPSDAAANVERLLHRGSDEVLEEDETDVEHELLEDSEERAKEFIKDRVSKLSWEQMQELVAGLLRAMGYKTRISPAGPDKGKDIVASPDGFGFEQPRIVVEVKHRGSAIGSPDIRSFLGGRHPDDRGLYVSTGGFTKDSFYEADRASIPLTLMDLDELVRVLIQNYEAPRC
jgi:restriction system protein